MRLTQIILILAILIVSQGCESEIPAAAPTTAPATAAGFDLQGYKSVEFGMPQDQLEDLGFDCPGPTFDMPDGVLLICSKLDNETLFGKPAMMVGAIFKDGKLSEINVRTGGLSNEELIELYQKSLGKPKMYELKASGGTIHTYYWISAQGTSISVKIYLDQNRNHGNAIYKDAAETSKLLKERGPSIDTKDF